VIGDKSRRTPLSSDEEGKAREEDDPRVRRPSLDLDARLRGEDRAVFFA